MHVDRLRWLVENKRHYAIDGAGEIARAAPELLAEIERLTAYAQHERDLGAELHAGELMAAHQEIERLRAECRAHRSEADRHYARAVEEHAEVERLRAVESAAKSACFHYWNCEGACNEYKGSMALLARAVGYTDPAADDEIADVLSA
jgi:hypothetical protein